MCCFKNILFLLSDDIRYKLSIIGYKKLTEIRLRLGYEIALKFNDFERFLDIICTKEHIKTIMLKACNYSLYAYEEEIKRGFITTEDGIRIGICGDVNMEGGQVKSIKEITSLNIRIPYYENINIQPYIKYLKDGAHLLNTLIVAPPGYGKTTFLRELIIYMSNKSYTVGVIDERMELSVKNLGKRSDVFYGGDKKACLMMMIRSMAPDIIAFDEIDPFGELDEIKYGLTCGITYVTTIHGKSYYDIKNKSLDNLFERYIILDNKYPYNVSLICDRSGNTIYERS